MTALVNRKASRRQLAAALDTLAVVSETEELGYVDGDHIAAVRSLLWDILDERDRKRGAS